MTDRFNLVFGYMNENWQEELNVPVGADNSILPGGPDQGQPTHFLPRRNRFIFRVRVPKDFGTKEVVWSLTTHGKTEKAFGTLRPDMVIENVGYHVGDRRAGVRAPAARTRADKPPVVTIEGPKTRTARVDEPVELVTMVTDDGIPKVRQLFAPARGDPLSLCHRPGPLSPRFLGLHLAWFVYRGGGRVSFAPARSRSWKHAIWRKFTLGSEMDCASPFSRWQIRCQGDVRAEPGTYTLCARADDGALTTDEMLTINVTR